MALNPLGAWSAFLVNTTTFGLLGMSDPCLKPTILIFSIDRGISA